MTTGPTVLATMDAICPICGEPISKGEPVTMHVLLWAHASCAEKLDTGFE